LALFPQEAEFALTEIVPPVTPAVAEMEVVAEVPLHPDGKVQV
jgi:hypothetical protein